MKFQNEVHEVMLIIFFGGLLLQSGLLPVFIILIVFIEPMTLRVTLCCLEFKEYSAYMGTGKTVATSINITSLYLCYMFCKLLW